MTDLYKRNLFELWKQLLSFCVAVICTLAVILITSIVVTLKEATCYFEGLNTWEAVTHPISLWIMLGWYLLFYMTIAEEVSCIKRPD